MKRMLIVLLTAAACAAALCACTAESESEENTVISPESPESAATGETGGETTQISNPWTEYESLDEMNAAAGSTLKKPTELDVTDETFSALAGDYTVVQYTFGYGGAQYTLRAAATQEDISGVWKDGQPLGDIADGSGEDTAFEVISGESSSGLWSRWFDGETQYSLYAEGATAEDYAAVKAALQ